MTADSPTRLHAAVHRQLFRLGSTGSDATPLGREEDASLWIAPSPDAEPAPRTVAQTMRLAAGLLGQEPDVRPVYWPAVWKEYGDEALAAKFLGDVNSPGSEAGDPATDAVARDRLQWQANVLRRLRELVDQQPDEAESEGRAALREQLDAAELAVRRAAQAVAQLRQWDKESPEGFFRHYVDTVVPQVCTDLSSWLEQVAALISVYHIRLYDADGDRRELDNALSEQTARAEKAEIQARDAEMRLEVFQKRQQEELLRARAAAMLGKDRAADQENLAEEYMEELRAKWELQYLVPLREELASLKADNANMLEMLRAANKARKEAEDQLQADAKSLALKSSVAQGLQALNELLEDETDAPWDEGAALVQEALNYLQQPFLSGGDANDGDEDVALARVRALLVHGGRAAAKRAEQERVIDRLRRALRAAGSKLSFFVADIEAAGAEVPVCAKATGVVAGMGSWATQISGVCAQRLPASIPSGGRSPGGRSSGGKERRPGTPSLLTPASPSTAPGSPHSASPGSPCSAASGQAETEEEALLSLGCGEPPASSFAEALREALDGFRKQVKEEARQEAWEEAQSRMKEQLEKMRKSLEAKGGKAPTDAAANKAKQEAEEALKKLEEDLSKARAKIKELQDKLQRLQEILEKKGLGKQLKDALHDASLSTMFDAGPNGVFARLFEDATRRLNTYTQRQKEYVEENARMWERRCFGWLDLLDQESHERNLVAKSVLARTGHSPSRGALESFVQRDRESSLSGEVPSEFFQSTDSSMQAALLQIRPTSAAGGLVASKAAGRLRQPMSRAGLKVSVVSALSPRREGRAEHLNEEAGSFTSGVGARFLAAGRRPSLPSAQASQLFEARQPSASSTIRSSGSTQRGGLAPDSSQSLTVEGRSTSPAPEPAPDRLSIMSLGTAKRIAQMQNVAHRAAGATDSRMSSPSKSPPPNQRPASQQTLTRVLQQAPALPRSAQQARKPLARSATAAAQLQSRRTPSDEIPHPLPEGSITSAPSALSLPGVGQLDGTETAPVPSSRHSRPRSSKKAHRTLNDSLGGLDRLKAAEEFASQKAAHDEAAAKDGAPAGRDCANTLHARLRSSLRSRDGTSSLWRRPVSPPHNSKQATATPEFSLDMRDQRAALEAVAAPAQEPSSAPALHRQRSREAKMLRGAEAAGWTQAAPGAQNARAQLPRQHGP